MKLVFVHGTGVRNPSYESTLGSVRARLQRYAPKVEVLDCYWGGEHGCRLNSNGASIPTYDTTRSAPSFDGELSDEDVLITLWQALYQNPLFEISLHRLALEREDSGLRESGDYSMLELLASGLPQELLERFQGVVASETLQEVARWLTEEQECIQLSAKMPEGSEAAAYAEVIARAVVARVVDVAAEHGEVSALAEDAILRDELVAAIEVELAGANRGYAGSAFEAIKSHLLLLAAWPATGLAAWRRGRWMDATSPIAGDILLYQARGGEIREFIRKRIQAAQDDVVLLAHSLGGVACVDMLIERSEPAVKRLITAGSQAPYFYELGALYALPHVAGSMPEERLPGHFPDWLNFYDPRDFLSFVGSGVFGERVTDERLDNRQPFPHAHGAYWSNETMWKKIAASIGRL